MQGVDLHTHSHFSDGELSPTALVHYAKQCGVHTFALTDHDTFAGQPEAAEAAATLGIRFITGIELTVTWHYQSPFITLSKKKKPHTAHPIKEHVIHIVGLNISATPALNAVLQRIQQARGDRAVQIAQKLQTLVHKDPLPTLLSQVENDANRLGRTHFAQWLQKEGHVNQIQQAFDRYLAHGKPAYVPLPSVTLAEGIQAIHQAHGIAVLAHPAHYRLGAHELRSLMQTFIDTGGKAIEFPKTTDPAGTRNNIIRFIREHHLFASTASDFHGAHMPWHKLGQTPVLPDDIPHVLTLI